MLRRAVGRKWIPSVSDQHVVRVACAEPLGVFSRFAILMYPTRLFLKKKARRIFWPYSMQNSDVSRRRQRTEDGMPMRSQFHLVKRLAHLATIQRMLQCEASRCRLCHIDAVRVAMSFRRDTCCARVRSIALGVDAPVQSEPT